jgi:sensor histidine kinase regulating citrate/malate metabolism
LQARYTGRGISFHESGTLMDMRLPAELFDSTAVTLVENALYKAAQDSALQVTVTLSAGPRLRVCDTGMPVPPAVAEQILVAPVASESGLGVGLFQAAKFAEQSGYALMLAENRQGSVCFELARLR